MKTVLAFDIGGTKISTALVNQFGQILDRLEVPTFAHEGANVILKRIHDVGHQLLSRHPELEILAVGAASAGQIDIQTGRVIYATPNLPGWTGMLLGEHLSQSFHARAICDNDINAMAQAEISIGAGQGIRELLCVMVGTGIGGAIVSEGKVLHGNGGIGEIGHITIDSFAGRQCNCGSIGCLEAYASSQALLSDFLVTVSPRELHRRTSKLPEELTILDLAAIFHQDPLKQSEPFFSPVKSAGQYLGWGLASAAN